MKSDDSTNETILPTKTSPHDPTISPSVDDEKKVIVVTPSTKTEYKTKSTQQQPQQKDKNNNINHPFLLKLKK